MPPRSKSAPPGQGPAAPLPPQAAERLAAMLADAREGVRRAHGKAAGVAVAREFSDAADALSLFLATEVAALDPRFAGAAEEICLVALGGYGRRELNLHSDVDLLFLLDGPASPAAEDFIRSFMYPLWDLKVEVGYTIRTVDECVSTIGNELETATALVSSRALWGARRLHDALHERLRRILHLQKRRAMAAEIAAMTRARHGRSSNTVYLLEPHLKESPGGLRDIHMIEWSAFVCFGRSGIEPWSQNGVLSRREAAALESARSFLLELRNALHLHEGRKTDLLSIERQMRVAPSLGYEAEAQVLPEEHLMRAYYGHASVVGRAASRVLAELERREAAAANGGETGRRKRLRSRRLEGVFWTRGGQVWIEPAEASALQHDPSWLMHLFAVMALYDLEPDDYTLSLVEDSLSIVDEEYRRATENRIRFLAILGNKRSAARVLRAMHRSRFLESYIPEFGLVRNLPRIDFYHRFTVDEHLLRSVECALRHLDDADPLSSSHAGRVAGEILRWDLLVLSLLFHDAGKGEGRGHVIRGAHMIQRVGARIGMSPKECQVLHDLVLNHQRITHVALHRNSEDPRVAEQLARDLGSRELLRMLYVHTCCDIMAVSEGSWNDWRATLLASLFERAMEVLRGRAGLLRQSPAPLGELVAKVLEEGGEGAKGLDEAAVKEFLSNLPERYRRLTPPDQIARHAALAATLGPARRVAWIAVHPAGSNYAEIHSVALDSPELFANLTGALSSRGLNILSAQAYTAKSGICIDVFQVQNQRGAADVDDAMLERLRRRLNEVLRGERRIEWRQQMPGEARGVSAARMDARPPTVAFHDDEEHYSVIEVKAPDRPGLLHDIATVLDKYRLATHLALVSTESYQVVDVFYVTDWDNNRLEPGPQTEALRKELLEVVSPDRTVG